MLPADIMVSAWNRIKYELGIGKKKSIDKKQLEFFRLT